MILSPYLLTLRSNNKFLNCNKTNPLKINISKSLMQKKKCSNLKTNPLVNSEYFYVQIVYQIGESQQSQQLQKNKKKITKMS